MSKPVRSVVSPTSALSAEIPEELMWLEGSSPVVYRRNPAYIAVHAEDQRGLPAGAAARLQGDGIWLGIYLLPCDAVRAGSAEVGPVYQISPASSPAVPTGRVFVQFEVGQTARSRSGELAAAG